MPLKGKKIVVCVTGSVAAIETPKLVRELRRRGAQVYCVMSPASQRVIHPDVLHWASDNEVVTELTGKCQHVKLAGLVPEKADLIVVAPSTANTVGKIASGVDDTSVTTVVSTALGSSIPIIIVPAMHLSLFQHPLLQENIAKLEKLGVSFVYPRLEENKAKFLSIELVVEKIESRLREKDFQGKKIIITAGATREKIDEVRFISNKSSGKMGWALAEAALNRGAEVLLIKGKDNLKAHALLEVIEIESAQELAEAIKKNCSKADVLIHAAAVSDFTVEAFSGKISSQEKVSLELKPAQKILEQIRQWNPKVFLVGFKAEANLPQEELVEKTFKKLKDAQADLMVANDVARSDIGFGSDFNEVVLVNKEKKTKLIFRQEKLAVANLILDEVNNALQ